MAWTGIAVVKKVSSGLARITGISLAGNTSGTISLHGGGGEIELPDGFDAEPYESVTLADAVQVSFVHTVSLAGNESRHVHVEKANNPFLITITNDQNQTTSELEFYCRFH